MQPPNCVQELASLRDEKVVAEKSRKTTQATGVLSGYMLVGLHFFGCFHLPRASAKAALVEEKRAVNTAKKVGLHM